MRFARWLHAACASALVALPAAATGASPTQGSGWSPARTAPPELVGATAIGSGSDAGGSGSGSGAGSDVAELVGQGADVPAWSASPPRVAVAPFENHSNVRALDWLIAGAPFEIAEKTEDALAMPIAGGPLAVPFAAIDADPDPVAAYARQVGATYVVTGWIQRPNWELRLDAAVWKVGPGGAVIVGEAKRQGPIGTYAAMMGEVLVEMWSKAGVHLQAAQIAALARPLSKDLYPIELFGRGLGDLTGALAHAAPTDATYKLAEKDLDHAAKIDPKMSEIQRAIGELELAQAPGDAKAAARAAGRFNTAADLLPDNIAALRASAGAAATAGKHDLARELYGKLLRREPWDLDARDRLGEALWAGGDALGAQRQLEQVTAHDPDQLRARRVLALIHASRSDTPALISELSAIAVREPGDLDVKADLANAYGAIGRWRDATAQLEAIAAARAPDLELLVRIGDAHREAGELDPALAWYARASRLAPESSYPGFIAAQALYDAGRLADATHAYTLLQKYPADLAAAQEALGAIALAQNRPDDAAWYLRQAVRAAPRSLITRRAVIAAELARKDTDSALAQLEPALAAWPHDGGLHYLAAIAHAQAGERDAARKELALALAASPSDPTSRIALATLDAGGTIALAYKPELARPWGDASALAGELDQFGLAWATMGAMRLGYQLHVLAALGALGIGPSAHLPLQAVRTCPAAEIAPDWAAAQRELARYLELGVDLEASYRFIVRHREVGATAALLPHERTQVAVAQQTFRTALADAGELRAEWSRGLGSELAHIGCTDKLLAAALADPARYHVIRDDSPEPAPKPPAPRTIPKVTFYVDNSRCPDPIDVALDGVPLGEVEPHQRTAFLADAGERSLCLLAPGAAQCGDRGTTREVYLHDGWQAVQHCPDAGSGANAGADAGSDAAAGSGSSAGSGSARSPHAAPAPARPAK